jgi:hypothetical protein
MEDQTVCFIDDGSNENVNDVIKIKAPIEDKLISGYNKVNR